MEERSPRNPTKRQSVNTAVGATATAKRRATPGRPPRIIGGEDRQGIADLDTDTAEGGNEIGPTADTPPLVLQAEAGVNENPPTDEDIARAKKRESNRVWRERQGGLTGRTRKPRSTPTASADAGKAAAAVMAMFETLAVTLAGPQAQFNATERALISEALPPILADLTPETMAGYPRYIPGNAHRWVGRVGLARFLDASAR